ncbi:MAG: type III pantothenate kinase [Oscillospiraceae bacterium]|jgi:type III pantothenate kinase|nr:type III pantothenate kinase [Oscillospiraceae bacterium]
MILAFDIGNTNIVIGGFEKDKAIFLTRVATDLNKTEAEYAVLIKNILEIYRVKRDNIEGSIVSSVVPPLNNVLIRVMELISGKSPLVVGPGIKTGLNIASGDPRELGADLVVAAVAALQKYPRPQIILDLGTATTFSALDKDGVFRGVVIYPGVMVSFDALASRTAQLPRISFDEPKQVIGTTSVDSMQSGLIYGNAAMLDGLIDRIEAELGDKCTVIATGGLSGKIVPHCRREIILDEDLLLDGLRILYEKNQKPKKV